jgi:hypothetical protein
MEKDIANQKASLKNISSNMLHIDLPNFLDRVVDARSKHLTSCLYLSEYLLNA